MRWSTAHGFHPLGRLVHWFCERGPASARRAPAVVARWPAGLRAQRAVLNRTLGRDCCRRARPPSPPVVVQKWRAVFSRTQGAARRRPDHRSLRLACAHIGMFPLGVLVALLRGLPAFLFARTVRARARATPTIRRPCAVGVDEKKRYELAWACFACGAGRRAAACAPRFRPPTGRATGCCLRSGGDRRVGPFGQLCRRLLSAWAGGGLPLRSGRGMRWAI